MPATPGLDNIGIEIADVGFSRLAFPPANTEAVYGRMVADLNQKSVQYQAEGMATASVLEQNGITEAKTIVGEATSKAGGIRGDADRQALEIISGVAKTDAQREFYQYWKSLDFLKASFAKNTILVLSTDSPLWKRLFGATQMPASSLPQSPAGSERVPVPTTQPERK
jgi:regulator of protease activity HflC (stomatin/prohibitin superfamily)